MFRLVSLITLPSLKSKIISTVSFRQGRIAFYEIDFRSTELRHGSLGDCSFLAEWKLYKQVSVREFKAKCISENIWNKSNQGSDKTIA